jgi:two-component system osmolarity sensor histidine kinase EnvZ
MYLYRKASRVKPKNLIPQLRHRFGWLKSGLFWRTFVLLAFLITASIMAWVISFQAVERTPRAQQMAAQVISIVTVTRAALMHSAPDLRRDLLFDLASNEGIRIYPLEDSDVVIPPPDSEIMSVLAADVKARLGNSTRFAASVNDVAGFWVSFKIEDDAYWLRLDRERIEQVSNVQWLGWATTTLLLSLLGAVFISRLINQPLSRITSATRAVAKGQHPPPLPEKGPTEIREANRSFNQMIADLHRIDSDRTVILAGISHDLRTPLARMQLELEMAKLPEEARAGMQTDLEQMDDIIAQFLDYAKPSDASQATSVNLNTLLADCAHSAGRLPNVRVSTTIGKDVNVFGNATDLKRIVNNLVENARRYGKTPGTGITEIHLSCKTENGQAVIEVADSGAGVPESEMERLLRPFTRLDAARGQANGAGLGLAIVERIVKRHNGTLKLSNNKGGGLRIRISMPVTGTLG